jgi:hypothetical protein
MTVPTAIFTIQLLDAQLHPLIDAAGQTLPARALPFIWTGDGWRSDAVVAVRHADDQRGRIYARAIHLLGRRPPGGTTPVAASALSRTRFREAAAEIIGWAQRPDLGGLEGQIAPSADPSNWDRDLVTQARRADADAAALNESAGLPDPELDRILAAARREGQRLVAQRRALLRQLLEGPVCFDTMVPLALAGAGQVPLLTQIFGARAIIPPAVYDEIKGLSYVRYPAAARLLWPVPFARRISLSPEEQETAEGERADWRRNDQLEMTSRADQGEAECLALCRRDPTRIALVSQDHAAVRAATHAGITVFSAGHVCLAFALRGTKIEAAWEIYRQLVDEQHLYPARDLPADASGAARFQTTALAMAKWL